jgi:putative Mg2+ transporter-C (MgtC) family protein
MFDLATVLHVLQCLGAATILGGLVGLERELQRSPAGLRTHIMVALGSAMLMLVGVRTFAATPGDISRIIQGIATGVGFIGAGTILKLSEQIEVRGLTTASSIWVAAAVGTACGVEMYALALVGTVMAVFVLHVLKPLERWLTAADGASQPPAQALGTDQSGPRSADG